MAWRETIERYRALDTNDHSPVLMLLNNAPLLLLTSVWPKATLTLPEEDHPADNWAQLWASVKYDEGEISELTGQQLNLTRQLLSTAIKNRLIYPDGTVHRVATLCIQKRIKEYLS